MDIRKARQTDLIDITKIYQESFDKEVLNNIEYTDENIYVVEDQGIILGMCMINYINNIFSNEKTGYINLVCVKSEYRGQGVGTFMLKELEKVAKRKGVTMLMLTSNKKRCSANTLYKNLDYVLYDTNVYKKKIN